MLPPRHRSTGLLFIALLALTLSAACQGNFEPLALDSPRDPANSQLPATPMITGPPSASCADGVLTVRIEWSADDDQLFSGFQLYRGLSPADDPGTLVATIQPSARSFIDGAVAGIPGLAPRTLYYYRIRSLGPDGTPSLRSAAAAVVTPLCP